MNALKKLFFSDSERDINTLQFNKDKEGFQEK